MYSIIYDLFYLYTYNSIKFKQLISFLLNIFKSLLIGISNMTFLEFLNEATQNIQTTNAVINLQLANEDDKDKAKLSKFVVALKKNGIVLGDLKDDTFNKIEFTAKKFDYEAFINSLKGVYNDFEQEVSVNGSFIYDDKKYNIETEEEMIYVDVV